jgi:hypothetical protein
VLENHLSVNRVSRIAEHKPSLPSGEDAARLIYLVGDR